MANRAQSYGMNRQTIRAVAANERKAQKRERKRKMEALRRYRRAYIELLDLAMQGKEFHANIGYSGTVTSIYCGATLLHMEANEWSKSKKLMHADEVRLFIRRKFEERDGLKPWQMDKMEQP